MELTNGDIVNQQIDVKYLKGLGMKKIDYSKMKKKTL